MKFRSTLAFASLLSVTCGLDDDLPGSAPRFSDIASSAFPSLNYETDVLTNAVRESQLVVLRDLFNSHVAASGRGFLDWFKVDDREAYKDYCAFHGVLCDSSDRVIALDLNSTGLSGSLPSSFGSLSQLRRFRVYNNSLTGELPSSLYTLTHLRQLNMGRNKLVGPLSEYIGSLHRLRHVMFQHNDFVGSIPSNLCRLENMTALDILENRNIEGELPVCLGDVPHLKILRIRNVGLTGQLPPGLCLEKSFNDLEPNRFGCDGIACSAGYFAPRYGRQIDDANPCLACDVLSNVLGSTTCLVVPTKAPSGSPAVFGSPSPSRATEDPVKSGAPSFVNFEGAASATPTVALVVSAEPSAPSESTVLIAPTAKPSTIESASPSSPLEHTAVPSTIPTAIHPIQLPTQEFNESLLPSFAPSVQESRSASPTVEESTAAPSSALSLPTLTASETPSSYSTSSLRPSMFPSFLDGDFPPTSSSSPSGSPSILAGTSVNPTTQPLFDGIEGPSGTEKPDGGSGGNRFLIPLIPVVFCCLCVVIAVVVRRRRNRTVAVPDGESVHPADTDQSSFTADPYGASRRDQRDFPRVTIWDGNNNMESDMEITLDTDQSDSRSLQSSPRTDSCSLYDESLFDSRGLAMSQEDVSSVASSSASMYSSTAPILSSGPTRFQESTVEKPHPLFLQASQWIKSSKVQPMGCGPFEDATFLQNICPDTRNQVNKISPEIDNGVSSAASVDTMASIGSRVPMLKGSQESSSASTPLTSNQSLDEEKYHRHLVLGATSRRPMLTAEQNGCQDQVAQNPGVSLPFLRSLKWLPVGSNNTYK